MEIHNNLIHIFKFFYKKYIPSCGSAGKESACNAGDLGLISGLGRPPGEGNTYPLQYSGLETSMDCICPWGHKESGTTEQLSLSPRWRMVISSWAQDSWNTILLSHEQSIRINVHILQSSPQIFPMKTFCPKSWGKFRSFE